MKSTRNIILRRWIVAATLGLCTLAWPANAQVNPAEISNPRLKALQTNYFSQIKTLYKQINDTRFPFPFALSRYVGLDPAQQPEADARGIEFINFHDRVLLKITGNYNAAFGAERLTQNERASHTFADVIAPVIGLVAKSIPSDVDCDGIGFEISYHVRTLTKNYDYEGKEILVVVLDRADAFAFAGASTSQQRQEILNRSEIYLDGKLFGLALDGKSPLDLESLGRTGSTPSVLPRAPTQNVSTPPSNSAITSQPLVLPGSRSQTQMGNPNRPGQLAAPENRDTNTPPAPVYSSGDPAATVTNEDVDKLQAQFQAQFDALAKEGVEKHHFVAYAPPSFVIYRNQIVLQFTLRNTNHFSPDSTSIYKRAAQSFDLFLAPQLKDILDKIPADASFAGFDITVLNQLGTDAHSPSEAIEFICPRSTLRKFVDADITNQQLIDQSVVLVNGVRVALNLQLVE